MDPTHPYLGLCAAATLVALGAGLGAWSHRRTARAAGPLAVVLVGLSGWSAMLLLQAVSSTGPLEAVSVYGRLLVACAVIAGFFCETQALVTDGWRPGRRTVGLLAIHPAVLVVAIATNPWLHLLAGPVREPGNAWLPWTPGPLMWAHLGYCYLVIGRCGVQLVQGLRTASTQLQLRQIGSVLFTAALPTAGTLLALTRPANGGTRMAAPVLIIIACVIHYYAVLRHGKLDLVPVARTLVIEHLGDAVLVVDGADRVVDVNPAATRLVRHLHPDLPGDLLGLPVGRLLPLPDLRAPGAGRERTVEGPDGPVDLDLQISELTDRHGRPIGRAVVLRDVTDLLDQRRRLADANRRLREQLRLNEALHRDLAELAVRDELTGLHNRRHLLRQLEDDLQAARSGAWPLSVMLLDIDHFKAVNDRNGHGVGDDLLVATAQALTTWVRPGDTVARYGGEEFVVVLPGASLPEALHMAELLRARCASVHVDGRYGAVSTTVSAGVSAFPECGWTGGELLQSADDALYAAKRGGRDQVVCAPSV